MSNEHSDFVWEEEETDDSMSDNSFTAEDTKIDETASYEVVDSQKSLLEQLNEGFIRSQPHSLRSYSKLLKILRKFRPELPATSCTALQSLKSAFIQRWIILMVHQDFMRILVWW
jgi:hypothetical protein